MRDRLAQLRQWRPSPAAVRRVFLWALVMNTVIVVTGGAVRLTASGLGCPTVPRCTDESLVPTREMGVHGFIEFGNRQLTFVLSAAVVAALVVAWRARRPDLLRPAVLLLAGIVVQAMLGAVTVLTELHPATVMAHFLVSMGLIAVAALAHERAPGEPLASPRPLVRREVVVGTRALVGVAAVTLLLGTVVTGTGPHSGDKNAQDRFPFDLATVSQLHADAVFLLVGLTAGLLVTLWAVDAPAVLRRRAAVLLGVELGQGAVGYVQYVTDLPVVLVGVHVLGASLVWIAALRVLLGSSQRSGVPGTGTASARGRSPDLIATGQG